jgi:flavin reductase (DIM6/NTAB) family NADH-FMN oxidoreductase RutF
MEGSMAIEPEIFKSGMRRLAAGVSIITTTGADGPRGLTATAVCSVSVVPPILLCCINRNSSAHDTIRDSGILAVNFLAGPDRELATRFGGAETRESRFVQGSWITLATGAPILDTALASFDCRVVSASDGASHSIFFAEVIELRIGAAADPLLYFEGAYGGFAATQARPLGR